MKTSTTPWLLAAVCGTIAAIVSNGTKAAPPLAMSSADTMEKVFCDEFWERPSVTKLTIAAARNEVEGIQLVLGPAGADDVRSVSLKTGDLVAESGTKIHASNITWHVVGYVETEKPAYAVHKVGLWPDPLLPDRTFDVKAGRVQPAWISVSVPRDAAPGLYRGEVKVCFAAGASQSVPLEVRVWDFAIPKQQHLETCFPLRPDQLKRFYKLPEVPIETYERWIDFCLDHRISINLCDWPRFDADLERLVSRQLDRGGSAFCIGYAWFSQGEPEARRQHNARMVAQIKRRYELVKKRGWLDRAYVYCHDEIAKGQYTFAHELYSELEKAMPDLRLMQTFYKDEPVVVFDDVLDIWAPNTARYRQKEFQTQQAKGDGVWWHVCCGPGKPFANLMIEWPAVDHRLLVWQNWKFKVNGLLYWGLGVWRDYLEGEKRWPEAKWDPATWRNQAGQAHNGDGQLIYPGPDGRPLSSIRLENLRDGIEDFEYFCLLRDALARLKKSGDSTTEALIAEAEKTLPIDDVVVKDLTHFTSDPKLVRRTRATLAGLIERVRHAKSITQSMP